MAVVTGQRHTGNVASTQRAVEMHKPILLLEPDSAPLTVFLNSIYNGGRRRPVGNHEFKWHEDELEDRWDAVNNVGGYLATDTSIVVDDGTLFAAEDLVYVPRTAEVMSVTSISTNTLTVVRGFGDANAAALVDDDPLYIIGTAAEQGDTSPAPRSGNPTAVTNYTQIFRNTIAASGTWLSSSNESTPHDWPYQARKTAIEHNKDRELAFLFGAPANTTGADGGPRTATGGLNFFLTQNRQDAGGALTLTELETFIRTVTRYGKKKVLFASRKVGSVLNEFPMSKLQTVQSSKTFGVDVMEFVSVHGSVSLVTHPLLEGTVLDGYAFAVDFREEEVKYAYLNGQGPGGSRDTRLLTGREENDRDGKKDEWLSECGLQVGNPKRHGVLYGVTSATV